VKAKLLAIPANADTYGKAPREFSNLQIYFYRKEGKLRMYLGTTASSSIQFGRKTKKGRSAVKQTASNLAGKPMFWLVPSVVQEADPNVLPPQEDLLKAAGEGVKEYFIAIDMGGAE
jgi:hypothetical protein